MSERLISFVTDEYFHIYNRGNSKQKIFTNDRDHRRFMQLLHLSNGTKSFKVRDLKEIDPYTLDMGGKLVSIGAYCLMPNHFHLLLKPLIEDGVSQFMKKLGTGYVMYFNQVQERKGSLFEGKFKSQHVDSDEYLKYLFSYIHLNPVKLVQPYWKEEGITNIEETLEFLKQYPYSSLQEYLNTGKTCVRPESTILDVHPFPNYFDGDQKYLLELVDWLSYGEVV